jgi:predicted ATPase
MKEKLIIKNFGPIKSVELDLGRFNVLIGENATGKSTIAKVLAMCRYFSYIADNKSVIFSKATSSFFQGLSQWGLGEFLKDDTYINFECKDYSFKVERNNSTLLSNVAEEGSVIYSTDKSKSWTIILKEKSTRFANLLKELEKIRSTGIAHINDPAFSWTIPTSFYQNDVASVLDNPFYLPAERGLQSIFSLGKSSIQNIADSLFNQLARLHQIAGSFKDETAIEPLNISYKNVDGRGYIKKNNEEEFYSLYSGASGYKSAIPIVLIVKYYCETRKKTKTFLIEEPELNLFPEVQQKLMQYLVDKTMNHGNNILVTTHSPYILTSLNNMMYASQVGKIHGEKTESILKKKYWLNPNDVSVYMLLVDGNCVDIFDREEGMIKAEKIDEVSRKLNTQFDLLQDIELGISEKK